jgi:NAD(P)-dependent dehydrogenase (short-subunit alcohol dehydrogenase family)
MWNQTDTMTGGSKTVVFFGASNGVGLSTLKQTLAAGHKCIALCRTQSKLTAIFPPESIPNLKIIQGNAHDVASVSKCVQGEDGKLVDIVVSTIGSRPSLSKFGAPEDAECCRKGAATLLEALDNLRRSGFTGNPYIVACSTTGMSRFGRDIPLAMVPLYHVALKVPHEDKRIMEDRFMESQEISTIVRMSALVGSESTRNIRVGVEDPKAGRESVAIGYNISKEDAGRWIAENIVLPGDSKYSNKVATITY